MPRARGRRGNDSGEGDATGSGEPPRYAAAQTARFARKRFIVQLDVQGHEGGRAGAAEDDAERKEGEDGQHRPERGWGAWRGEARAHEVQAHRHLGADGAAVASAIMMQLMG